MPRSRNRRGMKRGDCPVVQFEHEAILCRDVIGKSWRRSLSFRELVYETIELAQSKAN
jgi:hypothetical protein